MHAVGDAVDVCAARRAALGWGLSAVVATVLAGCSGVPLRSVPKLMKLSDQLLHAAPSEVMVALQVDKRLTPPADEVPQLVVQLTPKDPKAYAPIDKKLPLQLVVASGATLGLEAPTNTHRWLIYSLTAASQAELARIQALVRQAQAQPHHQKGGTLSLGIDQASMVRAVADPALSHTRWETWLQASRAEGFFKLWTGTPAQLAEQASKAR